MKAGAGGEWPKMKTRGRDSGAALAVVQFQAAAGPVEAVKRPEPPEELSAEQIAEWWAVVNSMPADWFPRETHGMLAQYCRHIVASRRVAELIASIEAEKQFDLVAYDRALKMQEREGRAMTSLATKMRISQQTRVDKSKKRGSSTPRPWD
jgi:hypothetical protein